MSAAPPSSSRTTWLALFAMAMAVVVIANDFTAINVALPTMERDFDTDIDTIQWVINAYALTFGVLIVTGGRLADTFGRRRCFFWGAGIFVFFSILAGAAQTETWLIAARALMGIGGALMWPAILGMTFALLPEEKAGLAGGIILGAAGLGNAIGPLVGGLLTDLASWRVIFFLNVPIAAFGVLVTYLLVHVAEPRMDERRIDYPGVVTLSLGLVALLIGLDQAADWGWGDPRVIGLLVVSAVLIAAFVPIERRAGAHALVPGALASNRRFVASFVAVPFLGATFFGAMLYLPQFMQEHLGYSPLGAGAGMLPFLATFAVVSFVAGPLYARLGAKALAVFGAICVAVAPLLFSIVVGESAGYGALVPGMVLLGIGVGTFTPTTTTAGVTAVGSSETSLAGGVLYMAQVAGGSIGLGLTTAVFATAYPPFVDGVRAAFRLDAGLALVAVAIAVFFIGGTLGRRAPAVDTAG